MSDDQLSALKGRHREVQIPLSAGSWAILSADFPLSESAWTQMMIVLNAMKPALVEGKEFNTNSPADPSTGEPDHEK